MYAVSRALINCRLYTVIFSIPWSICTYKNIHVLEAICRRRIERNKANQTLRHCSSCSSWNTWKDVRCCLKTRVWTSCGHTETTHVSRRNRATKKKRSNPRNFFGTFSEAEDLIHKHIKCLTLWMVKRVQAFTVDRKKKHLLCCSVFVLREVAECVYYECVPFNDLCSARVC